MSAIPGDGRAVVTPVLPSGVPWDPADSARPCGEAPRLRVGYFDGVAA